MSLIQVNHLTFGYEGSFDNVFEDASFRLDTDWKLGLIGRNGRGKTTLLNLLQGKLDAGGSIQASVDFAYFPFEAEDPWMLVADLAEEIVPGLERWKFLRELSLLDLGEELLYRPFGTLSQGEQTKVLLACLFLRENTFLLIDEPTNHLDLLARESVERYLRKKEGFILVSHDRALLDACTDHILSINRLNIEVQKGNYTTWLQNKTLQDDYERAENERLKKEIRRLSAAAKRASGWSDAVEKTKKGTRTAGLRPDRGAIGHKAAKMMKRAKSIEARFEAAAEEKEGLLRNIDTAAELKIHPLAHPKQTLVTCEKLSVCYGEEAVFSGLSFSLNRGERIALSGRNGCGKSSVLKLLTGQNIPHTGNLSKAGGLKLSYLAQDTSSLKGNLKEHALSRGIDESLFKAILRKLDFSRAQFEKDISSFSEGQKKKVLIAGSLSEEAHLYVWDEPLNYVDILSRQQIEELILAGCPTMIFVEHDRMFQSKIATRTVVFE